jgi:predicted Zn-dependent peptidase
MKEFYQPERMVLAGVGIDHQQLVDLGQKYFSVPKSENQISNQPTDKAVWTGGVIMVRIFSITVVCKMNMCIFCL